MVTDASRTVAGLGLMRKRADEVAELHDDDGGGWCQGCASEYSFAVPHPCTARRWADRSLVIAGTHAEVTE